MWGSRSDVYIIHKPRRQATLAVRGPQSNFFLRIRPTVKVNKSSTRLQCYSWLDFIFRPKNFCSYIKVRQFLKGCGMGPWLVLVSPCFGGNRVATCKIGSFLCSLDNLLQKNVIVLSFGNQTSKWRSFEKRAILDLLFTFFSHQGKVIKIPSAHISLTYMYTYFAHPIDFFCLTNFEKNTNSSGTVSL